MAKISHQLLFLVVCGLVVLQTKATGWVPVSVPLTFPEKAEAAGAVCLDGSPPAYQWIKAHDGYHDKWLIYLEGGGWCQNMEECKSRTYEHKGSSKHMMANTLFPRDSNFMFGGILDISSQTNPTEFRLWNRVVIRYCDGSSFTGDIEEPVDNIYFRGKRIFNVITEELLDKGLKDAKQVFLTGGSAGGVSVALHCDRFHKLLPSTTKFKCLIDGGYFIHAQKDPKQAEGFVSMFKDIVSLHNSTGMLPETCTKKMKDKPYLCMFPQYIVDDMVTPVFVLMTPYDAYQMNITIKGDAYSTVVSAIHDKKKIPMAVYNVLQDFRLQFLDALPKSKKPSTGIFINNCFDHTVLTFHWNDGGFAVNNLNDSKAVTEWYLEDKTVYEIDRNNLVKDCEKDKNYLQEILNQLI